MAVDDGAAPGVGEHPPPSRLTADGRRARLAGVPAVLLPALALVVLTFTGPPGGWSASIVVATLVGIDIFATVYVVLTWRTFAGTTADEFTANIAARQRLRRAGVSRLLPTGDGPSFALTAAVAAFSVVLVVPHIPSLRLDDWLLVPISMSILLSCWGLSVTSYALHYAQHDLDHPGLEFPGERTHAFDDYVYFALGVATTFGTTDVTVTTPRMRHIVNLNVVLAFVYNSVVVALLVSILIR
ncbi:MAG: DUF1345 domain-containing protein [Ilumatobacteraceae bacterium]